MTEAEWLNSNDPTKLLKGLKGKQSSRKLRLLAVACSRRIWHLLYDERSREAVEVAEAFADGLLGYAHLEAAYTDAYHVTNSTDLGDDDYPGINAERAASAADGTARDTKRYPMTAAIRVATDAAIAVASTSDAEGKPEKKEQACQCVLIRCIFGNPFRPVKLQQKYLTPTVRQVAESIYQERAFHSLPILADALEESGCTQQDLLKHLRNGGEHARGCWAVDLVLGKE